MKVVPQSFYQNEKIQKILVNGLSSIIYKKVAAPSLQNERYVSAHALTVVMHGQLKVEDDEGRMTYVSKGQMIFLPKGLYMISDIIPAGGTFEALVFFFDEALVNEFPKANLELGGDTTAAPPSFLVLNHSDQLQLYTDNLLALYSNGNDHQYQSLTNVKLIELMHLMVISDDGPRFVQLINALHARKKKSLKEFMDTNFDKPLTIEDYAYLTGRSVSTFHRDFKRQFDLAPKQWLINKRLEKARTLLLSDHPYSISDIGVQVGYENISHFIKAFHKKFGQPPKQFVIEHRSQIEV